MFKVIHANLNLGKLSGSRMWLVKGLRKTGKNRRVEENEKCFRLNKAQRHCYNFTAILLIVSITWDTEYDEQLHFFLALLVLQKLHVASDSRKISEGFPLRFRHVWRGERGGLQGVLEEFQWVSGTFNFPFQTIHGFHGRIQECKLRYKAFQRGFRCVPKGFDRRFRSLGSQEIYKAVSGYSRGFNDASEIFVWFRECFRGFQGRSSEFQEDWRTFQDRYRSCKTVSGELKEVSGIHGRLWGFSWESQVVYRKYEDVSSMGSYICANGLAAFCGK